MADYSNLVKYAESLGCVCRENEPMCRHTTFQIGGAADLFLEPASVEVLAKLIAACKAQDIPVTVIGNGSNLLVSDLGIEGAVFHIGAGLSDIELSGACELVCGAGAKLSRLCNFALEHSLTGLEFAWGIPGSAGGAAYMNAGAYGAEIGSVLAGCTHITPDGTIGYRTVEEMAPTYRHTAYCDSGEIIVDLHLKLSPGDPVAIRATMDDLMRRRKEKQPIELPSAGSTFKRPTGNFAGTLIEQAGLKGYRVGGAQVSEKHAGFVVNVGGATCSDVRAVMEHVRSEVFLRNSIRLEPEVRIIGRM